mgnify:CR=1 FL=1
MTTKHTPTPWTVSYMVREQKGDYLAAVEELEASREALVEALERTWDTMHSLHPQQYQIPVGKGICEWKPCLQARAALKAAKEPTP